LDKDEPETYMDTSTEVGSIIKKSKTRVEKALNGKPQYILSVEETQNVLEKFASSKINLVILHVDLVSSTKISMKLPLDRLTLLIQSFNQEMSLIVRDFGGYILKYVGDAVLAFFVTTTSGRQSQKDVACTCAINCAKCMIEVAQSGINPILDRFECPLMNLRIGIDMGENAIIQSGWDIHKNLDMMEKYQNGSNTSTKDFTTIKKPIYDILGYATNLAVKMTSLANPNHMIIGQLVYDTLDNDQRSIYHRLNVHPEVWNYISNNTDGKIYKVYTTK
jgi:adenylate cyclase